MFYTARDKLLRTKFIQKILDSLLEVESASDS
jgi:hypothetical protein